MSCRFWARIQLCTLNGWQTFLGIVCEKFFQLALLLVDIFMIRYFDFRIDMVGALFFTYKTILRELILALLIGHVAFSYRLAGGPYSFDNISFLNSCISFPQLNYEFSTL